MIADIQIDQDVELSTRPRRAASIVPGDLLDVIDHHHRAGFDDARHLQRIGDRRSQQQPWNPGGGHQFRFGDRGHAHADRARGDLALGDLHALVGFRVRPQGLAGFLDAGGHAREVGFELIQIQEKGGRGQLLLGEHQPIMQNAILGSLKLVQVEVPSEAGCRRRRSSE